MTGSSALLAAAGSGLRLGLGPKALVRVGGLTLLELSARALSTQVDELLIAVPADLVEAAQALVPGARVGTGGATRQETVASLAARATGSTVVVHDVARPLLPKRVLARVLAAARSCGAATAAYAPADTIVRREDGATVDREELMLVQTPQAFDRELLLAAHARATADGFVGTDDAGLVRRLGHRVELVTGSPLLLKLTTPADLPLFGALLPLYESMERTEREVAGPSASAGATTEETTEATTGSTTAKTGVTTGATTATTTGTTTAATTRAGDA